MAKGHRPAGGIKSRVVTEKPVRYGDRASKISERGVSQIGQSLGNHVTDRRQVVNPIEKVRAGAMGGMGSVPLGNAMAQPCGPQGQGRTVMRSGSQSAAVTRAIPAGRPILSDFGPDIPGRK